MTAKEKTIEEEILEFFGETGKNESNIEGMENRNPAHEIVLSVLRKHLKDADIVARYNKTEESLREIVITDCIMDNLDEIKRTRLKTKLQSGASLKDIIEEGSALMADGKLLRDNALLRKIDANVYKQKDFLHSVIDNYFGPIYLEGRMYDVIERGRTRAQAKRNRKSDLKIFLGVAASVLIGIGSYFAGSWHESGYETKLKQYERRMQMASEVIAKKKEEIKQYEIKKYQDVKAENIGEDNNTKYEEIKEKRDEQETTLRKTNSEMLYGLAWKYYVAREKNSALECAEQALKNDPENYNAKMFIKTLKDELEGSGN